MSSVDEEVTVGYWNAPEGPSKAPFMELISGVIHQREMVDANLLPNLQNSTDLVLASDYAGENPHSQFQVLGYLLADGSESIPAWDMARKAVRAKFLPDNRRIEFKSLGDGLRQKAMLPFLNSANSINGLVLCVAIDKAIQQIVPGLISAKHWASVPWKPDVWEKLVRIAIFGSILVGGLSRPGQKLLWITDEDAIVANDNCLDDACLVMGTALWHYCPKGLDDVSMGIAGKFTDERQAEDLVSIVDLAVGSVTEGLSLIGPAGVPRATSIPTPIHGHLSTKAKLIHSWLSTVHVPLKKLVCMVRPADGGLLFSFSNPEFSVGSPLARAMANTQLWLPVDRGWKDLLYRRDILGPRTPGGILLPSRRRFGLP